MKTMLVKHGDIVKLISFTPPKESVHFWATTDGKFWLKMWKKNGVRIKFVENNPYLKYSTTQSLNRGYSGGAQIAQHENAGWCYIMHAKFAPWDGKGVDIKCG